MKKINLTEEAEQSLVKIAEAANRELSTRIFIQLWEKLMKEVVDEPEQVQEANEVS